MVRIITCSLLVWGTWTTRRMLHVWGGEPDICQRGVGVRFLLIASWNKIVSSELDPRSFE